MFKIKTIIKYHLCCKYHKGLPELCESLTEENNNLKAENKKLLPTTEHVFSGCTFIGESGDQISSEVCLKCAEYKSYIINSKVLCVKDYKKVFIRISRDWSRTVIPMELFDKFVAEKEKKTKDDKEIDQLRKCLREPVCLIK